MGLVGPSRMDARLLDCQSWSHSRPGQGMEPTVCLQRGSRQDLLDIHCETGHHFPHLLQRTGYKCSSHWTPGVGLRWKAHSAILTVSRLLWLGTTTLLALDLKRRRSTVSPAANGTPRFSAETQGTEGDFEKQPNMFDNVSAAPVRDYASPVLPPASPDIDLEQIEPFQPYAIDQPAQ